MSSTDNDGQPPAPVDVKPPTDPVGAAANLRYSSLLPPPFRNSSDQSWDDWEEDFQDCATLNAWDDATRCHILGMRLQGPARDALRALSSDTKSKFSSLVAALRTRFLPANRLEIKRSTFRLRRQGPAESLLDFRNAVNGLSAQAFPAMDLTQRDLLARDQFLDGLLDPNLRLRVRNGAPTSLDDAVCLALEAHAAETAESRRRSQDLSISGDATAAPHSLVATATPASSLMKAVETQTALLTSVLERLTRNDASPHPVYAIPSGLPSTLRAPLPVSQRRCWDCGQFGHIRVNCPKFGGKHENSAQCVSEHSREHTPVIHYVAALQASPLSSDSIFKSLRH